MIDATVYRVLTGEILRRISTDDPDAVALNVSEGEAWVEGDISEVEYYILDGAPTAFPEAPGDWAVWDWLSHEWTDPRDATWFSDQLAAAWESLRVERDLRLMASDRFALPDYPHSVGQQEAWLNYRRALRDLPEATIDPTAPVWPDPPEI